MARGRRGLLCFDGDGQVQLQSGEVVCDLLEGAPAGAGVAGDAFDGPELAEVVVEGVADFAEAYRAGDRLSGGDEGGVLDVVLLPAQDAHARSNGGGGVRAPVQLPGVGDVGVLGSVGEVGP